MVRIAVCDDESAFGERVKTLIETECRDMGVPSEVILYTDSGMLAYDVGEKRYFDMLFLDIEMPGLTGMELAKLMKASLPQALVSFITSHTKYAVKSFELSIFRYIPKAEVGSCLPLAVADGIRLLSWKVKECYVAETPRQIVKVAVSDILYIYKKQKYSVMVLADGEVAVRKALGRMQQELDREEFLMIERGYYRFLPEALMNTVFQLCELAACFLEALICYFFIQLFFPEKAKGKIRFVLLSGVLLLTVQIADSLRVIPFLVTLWFVFYICMTTVLIFHIDVFYAVSLVSFYILCVYIIDFFCISVMGVLLKNQQFARLVIAQLSQWRLAYQAADKLLLTAAYFLARKAFRRELSYNPGMMFLTSGLGLCGVGFLSWLTVQETDLHALFGWSMCIILLFLSYFLLLFYSKYVGEQKQRLALELKEQMTDREYDLMLRRQREQEELSHNMKNHLLVLSSMLGEGRIREAETYLEQMGEPLRQLEMTVWTGNPVLDVLLNNARSNAAGKKIRFTIQSDAVSLEGLEDQETCTLFSNLLDNAVEAAEKVEEGKRWIYMKLRRAGEMIFLELSNSMAGGLSVKGNRLITTKREGIGHGLGLKSAERVVEKYGGSLVCEYGEAVFTVQVTFLEGFRIPGM